MACGYPATCPPPPPTCQDLHASCNTLPLTGTPWLVHLAIIAGLLVILGLTLGYMIRQGRDA